MKKFWIGAITLLFFASCGKHYTPKPYGYFRIDLPEKEYHPYEGNCPFVFDAPQYSRIVPDSSRNAEPCWLNMNFPPFNATLHLTYKPVGEGFNLQNLQDDTRRFVMNHTIKAQEIIETPIRRYEDRVHGVMYELTGNTATSLQFYVTDSSNHYLRGALYFNAHTNADSIAPVQKYLSYDVVKLIQSIRWK